MPSRMSGGHATWAGTLSLLAVAAPIVLGACGPRPEGGGIMPDRDIETVMNAHVDQLMALPGVTAVAIGQLADGTPCIRVYVVEWNRETARRIPDRLEGHPVEVEESGVIRPLDGDAP